MGGVPTAGACGLRERCRVRPHALARATAVAGVAVILALPSPAGVTARAVTGDAVDVVTRESLLERAGAYFLSFESRFSDVVTEERYVQEAMMPGSSLDVAITRRGGGVATQIPPSAGRRELAS